ncbi:MAG TPA: M3 family metallopeptidase, partial [Gammaproteobacteria bacterium]|nr:M3 family metallopeptidase [Gammaproteobacteria bacterium]
MVGFYQLSPEQFEIAVKETVAAYKAVTSKVKTIRPVTWEGSIQPLEEASESLDSIWSLLEHENAVSNTPEIRVVYENLLNIITNLHTEILQDEQLYKVYLDISESKSFAHLSIPQRTIIEHALRNFKLGGVNLPAESRAKLKELHERLSALENKFANNVLDATEGWSYHVTTAQKNLLEGLPERVITEAKNKAIAQEKTGWVLTLDLPTNIAVASYAQNRQLREEFYVAYYTRASDQGPMAGKWDNTQNIAEILKIRQEIAHITGYSSYADYALVPRMASNTGEVKEFLNKLAVKVKPQAEREFAELKAFAKQLGFAQEFAAWDVTYYAERMRENNYSISEEELRVYFPEPRVLDGLFKLTKNLFGIEIVPVQDFNSWHPSVRMFEVIDENKQLRGHFYIDLYTREGKRGGAWMAECISRIRFATNTLQTPIAYLNCNFAPPSGDNPGLLTHDDVVTLFHEFGHTLHHVLTQIDYYSVAGLNGVAWDAVELPSQFMENWAWEWSVIQDISKNVLTGEPMPRALFDRLLASKNFHAGMHLSRQLQFAEFDFRIHENVGKDV